MITQHANAWDDKFSGFFYRRKWTFLVLLALFARAPDASDDFAGFEHFQQLTLDAHSRHVLGCARAGENCVVLAGRLPYFAQ